uniref:Uncharacterized protein n=1 Tax=Lepeophtheirus salmonis TaxID=72036 RepID=A0A0K2USC5_LEPSM
MTNLKIRKEGNFDSWGSGPFIKNFNIFTSDTYINSNTKRHNRYQFLDFNFKI